MNRSLLHLIVAAFILFLFTSCEEESCPGDRKTLELTPQSSMLVQGQDVFQTMLMVQYPTDCELFPYRGTLSLELDQPDAIVGAKLYFIVNGQPSNVWTNQGTTPTSGLQSVPIYLAPDTVNGVPTSPTPGSYSVRISAGFDDPFDNDEAILQVEVLSGGLEVRIISPEDGAGFEEGTENIEMQAFASDSNNGIAAIAYRFNGGAWTSQSFNGEAEIDFEETLTPPTDPDNNGDQESYTLAVRATNLLGEIALDSVSFVIDRSEGDGGPITDVRWDGGGDGVHWHDPLNWDGDKVPTASNNVIIFDDDVEEVIITSTGELQDVYPVAGLTVYSDVLFKNGAVLEIARQSYFNRLGGDVKFENTDPDTEKWARISFSASNYDTEKDTPFVRIAKLFLGGAYLHGQTPGRIMTSKGYDGEDYDEVPAYAIISGAVSYEPWDNVNHYREFTWDLRNGGKLNNHSTWVIEDHMNFWTDPDETKTSLVSTGFMRMLGRNEGKNLTVNGNIRYIGRTTTLETGNGVEPGAVYFYNRGHNEENALGEFRTLGNIHIYYGNWRIGGSPNDPMAANTIYVGAGSERAAAPPLLNGTKDLQNLGAVKHIALNRGTFLIGSTYNNRFIPSVEVGLEGRLITPRETEEYIRIRKLMLSSGRMFLAPNDTLHVTELDWRGTEDSVEIIYRGPSEPLTFTGGTIVIDGLSSLDLGPGNHRFAHDFVIKQYGELAWLSGNLRRRIGQDPVYVENIMNIELGGTFLVQTGEDLRWDPWLVVFNRGWVVKSGSGDVEIGGCLFNLDDGRYGETDGDLDFKDYGNNRCD